MCEAGGKDGLGRTSPCQQGGAASAGQGRDPVGVTPMDEARWMVRCWISISSFAQERMNGSAHTVISTTVYVDAWKRIRELRERLLRREAC